jgi:hypothetical protein
VYFGGAHVCLLRLVFACRKDSGASGAPSPLGNTGLCTPVCSSKSSRATWDAACFWPHGPPDHVTDLDALEDAEAHVAANSESEAGSALGSS